MRVPAFFLVIIVYLVEKGLVLKLDNAMFRNNGTGPSSIITAVQVLIWCTCTAVSFRYYTDYQWEW